MVQFLHNGGKIMGRYLNSSTSYVLYKGKTVMANMITSFLGKKQDSDSVFKSLKISKDNLYNKYRNQYNVISIDFSKMPRECDS